MEMHEAIRIWEELEIKDEFMFAKVMQDSIHFLFSFCG